MYADVMYEQYKPMAYVCAFKDIDLIFMFEFRAYILYHIVSYSGVLLY